MFCLYARVGIFTFDYAYASSAHQQLLHTLKPLKRFQMWTAPAFLLTPSLCAYLPCLQLHSTFQQVDVAGCEANLVDSTKYGRDFCFEVVIANPRYGDAGPIDLITYRYRYKDV